MIIFLPVLDFRKGQQRSSLVGIILTNGEKIWNNPGYVIVLKVTK